MRLPAFTRIILEDFSKEVQGWIGKLVEPLNNFMLTVRNGLNKGLTVNDNMSGAIKTVSVTKNTIAFSYSSNSNPKAVILGSWSDQTVSTWSPSTAGEGISMKWSFSEGVITCTFYGTDSTHKYLVTLVILDD